MQQWIKDIFLPYCTAMIQEYSLPLDSKMILYIDCWTVHQSKEFRNWMKEAHPELILIYVLAGCTGIFQPCDVGLQRLFKHNIKKSASNYFVAAVQKKKKQEVAPAEIQLPTRLPGLQKATPLWIINAVEYFNTPLPADITSTIDSIGIRTWKNCRVWQWDLSYECIKSL